MGRGRRGVHVVPGGGSSGGGLGGGGGGRKDQYFSENFVFPGETGAATRMATTKRLR